MYQHVVKSQADLIDDHVAHCCHISSLVIISSGRLCQHSDALDSVVQETEEVYEVDGTFVHRSRMTPLPGAGIAEEAGIPGVPLKAAAKVRRSYITICYQV